MFVHDYPRVLSEEELAQEPEWARKSLYKDLCWLPESMVIVPKLTAVE